MGHFPWRTVTNNHRIVDFLGKSIHKSTTATILGVAKWSYVMTCHDLSGLTSGITDVTFKSWKLYMWYRFLEFLLWATSMIWFSSTNCCQVLVGQRVYRWVNICQHTQHAQSGANWTFHGNQIISFPATEYRANQYAWLIGKLLGQGFYQLVTFWIGHFLCSKPRHLSVVINEFYFTKLSLCCSVSHVPLVWGWA